MIIVDNKAPTLVGTNVLYDSDRVQLQFHENIVLGTDFNATLTLDTGMNYQLYDSQVAGNTLNLRFDDTTGNVLDITTTDHGTVTFTGVYDQYENGPTSGTMTF